MGFDLSRLSLNKNTPVPLYYQLKQELLTQINENLPGNSLPTELEITTALGISRSTVRQAFNELVSEGLIHRDKGRGTFISKPKVDRGFFQKLDSYNKETMDRGLVPFTQILDCCVKSGQGNINEHLQLDMNEQLIYLRRLRFADKEPLVYLETHLPQSRFIDMEKINFAEESLYAVLEERYSCKVIEAVRKIEAAAASPLEARYLSIRPGAPIMLVRTTAFDNTGRPVEYSIARYRGDRNQFTVELKR